MNTLAAEARHIQNPALGAALIWRFSCGYFQNHRTHDSAPLPLAYLVLPILYHAETRSVIESTRVGSGLRAAVAKFSESSNPRQDLLLGIHPRAKRFRLLTTRSLGLAIRAKLISVGPDARVTPLSLTPAASGLAVDVRHMLKDAEKIGTWFGQLTSHEVTSALKVRL